jgi:nanoRNase/pAp phosphatase (c-di-AMP/oligoRNAs hydrolase)
MVVVDAVRSVEADFDAIASTLQEEPLLAVGVVVAVIVLLGAGWALVRYLRRSPGEQFARLLGAQEAVGVLMHPGPDPDAMSCALAVGALAEQRDTDATLYYAGQIRHQENRAFQTVLDVTFEQIEQAGEIAEDEVVLVDHNRTRGFPDAEMIEPLAVVDHHPGNGTGRKFTDVRTDAGACATILSEYFESLGYTPVSPDELADLDSTRGTLDPQVSTALLYGIQSDTKNLTNGCSPAEFEAASYLYDGVDEGKLDRIANPDMDAESLDVKARAILEREIRSAFAVSDVGRVSNVDAIPQAAEELRRLEGVNAVVVLAEKDGVIHLSGRSNDDRVHMGKTLEAAVEDVPMSSAGGHARMGGGQISTEHMEGIGPGGGVTRQRFKERLFAAMNGEL